MLRTGADEIYMPFVKGTPAADVPDWWEDPELAAPYAYTERGLRIGILDQITINYDRNIGNWIIGTDGEPVPYDHGAALYGHFENDSSRFDIFGSRLTPERLRSISPDEWETMQDNLQALKRIFRAKGRPDWHQNMMDNFAKLRDMATDGTPAAHPDATADHEAMAGVHLGTSTIPDTAADGHDLGPGDQHDGSLTPRLGGHRAAEPADQPDGSLTPRLRGHRAVEPADQHDELPVRHQEATVTHIRDRIITRLPGHPGCVERVQMEHQLHNAIDSGVEASGAPGLPGSDSSTTVVLFKDGSKWVRKVADSSWSENDQDAEELTSWVSDAISAGAPKVIRTGPDEIWMPFVKGTPAADVDGWWEDPDRYAYTERGVRIGIMDKIVNNTDRNPGNWIIDPDGQPVPYDHGRARFGNAAVKNDMFAMRLTPERLRILSADDWDTMQQNLEGLRRVFRAKDKIAWYNAMMRHFAELRDTAGV